MSRFVLMDNFTVVTWGDWINENVPKESRKRDTLEAEVIYAYCAITCDVFAKSISSDQMRHFMEFGMPAVTIEQVSRWLADWYKVGFSNWELIRLLKVLYSL